MELNSYRRSREDNHIFKGLTHTHTYTVCVSMCVCVCVGVCVGVGRLINEKMIYSVLKVRLGLELEWI